MNLNDFIGMTRGDYQNKGMGITIHVDGTKELGNYLERIEGAGNLNDYLEDSLTTLYNTIYSSAPYDTHEYEASIDYSYNSGAMEGEISIGDGVDHARFLIYGVTNHAPVVQHGNSRGIFWQYTRIDDGYGILHDVRRVVYAWMRQFKIGLDDVNFTRPRDSSGRFTRYNDVVI